MKAEAENRTKERPELEREVERRVTEWKKLPERAKSAI